MSLDDKKCVPCEGGLAPLSAAEVAELLTNVEHWAADSENKSIFRKFKFKNFIDALYFVNKVGLIAEDENHHPDIEFGWGYCKVTLQTHSIKGLHQNDFIVANRINKLT